MFTVALLTIAKLQTLVGPKKTKDNLRNCDVLCLHIYIYMCVRINFSGLNKQNYVIFREMFNWK